MGVSLASALASDFWGGLCVVQGGSSVGISLSLYVLSCGMWQNGPFHLSVCTGQLVCSFNYVLHLEFWRGGLRSGGQTMQSLIQHILTQYAT